ncbi:MAG: peptidoglycan-binding protein [Pseudomonadota bacterium]
MNKTRKTRVILFLGAFAMALLSACGSTTYQQKKIVWEPFDAKENRQQRDNVTVELKFVDELPPSFFATVAQCDQYGRLLVDKSGKPQPERISLGTIDQVWQQVSITNGTDNVLRLNGVVIRLFNPGGEQFNVLTMSDLRAALLSKRPCQTTQLAMNVFAANTIFDRNIEIVPGTTSTFWVAFRPTTRLATGIWKMALYDVPVSLDPAGRPLRTTRFETRISVKEVTNTYTRESLLAQPKLIESSESSATGKVVTTPGAPVSPAATPAPTTVSTTPIARPAEPPSQVAPAPPSAAVTAQAQARLNALGLNAGSPDGVPGAKTRQAVLQFQRSRNLKPSGQLDADTLSALGL